MLHMAMVTYIIVETGGSSCYLPPVFEKRREVLFWGPSPYPPSARMFCFISRLLLKLAF